MDGIETWFWHGALLIGAAGLLIGIVTGQLRLEVGGPEPIEKRLARFPASAGAVVIKGQPDKTGWRWLAASLFIMVLAFAAPYVHRNGLMFLCGRLDAAETLWWTTALVAYVLPALLVLVSAVPFARSVRVLRQGYAPPLDAVLPQDTVAVSGWRAKLRGWFGVIALPVFVTGALYLGLNNYHANSVHEIRVRLVANCSVTPQESMR
jgi:hypothetical protein